MTQEERTHAITIITHMIKQLGWDYMPLYTDALDVALATLETCTVESPKDAQCIMREQENGWREDRLWSCSACGDERAMDGLPDEYDYNYCINCGAKIIGQEPLKLEVEG